MGNEYKKIGEYKVKEVYNDNGKKIQELLVDIFKSYCKEKMEKEAVGKVLTDSRNRRKNDNNK